jgi:hypothetical protein
LSTVIAIARPDAAASPLLKEIIEKSPAAADRSRDGLNPEAFAAGHFQSRFYISEFLTFRMY